MWHSGMGHMSQRGLDISSEELSLGIVRPSHH